jgi:hypothetical protein
MHRVAEVSSFIGFFRLRQAFALFLVAASLHAFQLWLASFVTSGAAVAEEAEKIGTQVGVADLNPNIVLSEYREGNIWLYSWIVRWSQKKAESGDINFGNRFLSKVSQWQATAVLLQSLLALYAVFLLVHGLAAKPG